MSGEKAAFKARRSRGIKQALTVFPLLPVRHGGACQAVFCWRVLFTRALRLPGADRLLLKAASTQTTWQTAFFCFVAAVTAFVRAPVRRNGLIIIRACLGRAVYPACLKPTQRSERPGSLVCQRLFSSVGTCKSARVSAVTGGQRKRQTKVPSQAKRQHSRLQIKKSWI